MKSTLFILLSMILISCESISLGKVDNPIKSSIYDLELINTGTVLGSGLNSSANTRNFISCSSSIVKIIPSFFKPYKIAFGAAPFSNCGQCSGLKFSCVPGENVLISGTYYRSDQISAGALIEPQDFDSNPRSKVALTSFTVVCPSEGFANANPQYSAATYVKLSASSNSNVDTEYLECQ